MTHRNPRPTTQVANRVTSLLIVLGSKQKPATKNRETHHQYTIYSSRNTG
jgi:hypothetical protein